MRSALCGADVGDGPTGEWRGLEPFWSRLSPAYIICAFHRSAAPPDSTAAPARHIQHEGVLSYQNIVSHVRQ
jgi:hypothetical protein